VPLRLVERELVACGYRVVTSVSPLEAFELCVRMKPDMVITAMVMSDLSGIELARAFGAMETTAKIPVGLLTSLAPGHSSLKNLPGNTAIIRAGEHFQDDLAATITRFGIA
jgi:CheY-like chemotaxis protein